METDTCDPEANLGREQEAAEVGPLWQAVHQAYRNVLRGKTPLAPFLKTLDPLEQWLRLAERHAKAAQDESDSAPRLVLAAARRSLDAVALLRRVVDTRSVADLHAGWAQLFYDALALQQLARSS